MEIKDIVHSVAKWWILIALLVVAAVAVGGFISFYMLQNEYVATAVMIISAPRGQQSLNQMTLTDYTLNVQLVNSYKVLCKTDRILDEVLLETGLPLSANELTSKIDVSAQNETEIINIAVTDTNPVTASRLANAVASVFMKEIPQIMQMDNVQIIDKATVPQAPVRPDRKMIIAVAGLIGLLLGIGIALLLEYFDVTIKSAEQFAKLMEAPALGMIPHLQEGIRK